MKLRWSLHLFTGINYSQTSDHVLLQMAQAHPHGCHHSIYRLGAWRASAYVAAMHLMLSGTSNAGGYVLARTLSATIYPLTAFPVSAGFLSTPDLPAKTATFCQRRPPSGIRSGIRTCMARGLDEEAGQVAGALPHQPMLARP